MEDAEHIGKLARRLDEQAFQSFVNEDPTQCANHSIVDLEWWNACIRSYG